MEQLWKFTNMFKQQEIKLSFLWVYAYYISRTLLFHSVVHRHMRWYS
jgi:hypothetical protein